MDNLERFGGEDKLPFPSYLRGSGPKWAELRAQSVGSEKRSCHFRTRLRGAGLAGCLAVWHACYVAKLGEVGSACEGSFALSAALHTLTILRHSASA